MPEADEIIPETEPTGEAEPEFTLPEDFADQVKGWGIPLDELPQAVALHKGLQTEEGVIDAFIRTGQSLGFGVKDLERLFAEEVAPAAPAAPAAPEKDPILGDDPERLLTAAEVAEIIRNERESFDQRFQQSEQQRQAEAFEAKQQAVFKGIDSWFASKEVSDPETRAFIAQLGEKTIPKGADSYDPAVVTAALERGYAEYEAFVEKQAQAYISKKAGTATAQPTHVGGGSPGGEGENEVDYRTLGSKALETAKERVRARLRDQGEM